MVGPGRRCLGDRYELSRLIASGGMGQVWAGRDMLLGRHVAVKVLRSEYTGDPTFLARFRAEAQHAAALSHPNIAAVFDYGEVTAGDGGDGDGPADAAPGEDLAYLVMELVDGEPLSSVLHREGALDPAKTLDLLRQSAFALAEAHRVGLVHRDVKPGNILVRADGSVKITDFGIAWSAGSVPLTRTGQVIGTPQYMSPEQAEGHLATPASDVYALGLVGYECLTGHSAFEGDNPVTIALKQLRQQPDPLPEELPPGVRTLISRALVKDPAGRLPDGGAFVEAIDDTLAGRALAEAPATVAAAALVRASGSRSAAAGPAPRPRSGPSGSASGPVPGLSPGPPSGPVAQPGPLTPGGSFRAPPPRRRLARRLAMVLVPVVTLLVGAGVAAFVVLELSGGQHSPAAAPPVVAAQTHDGRSYILHASDYIGRPVDEVALQLSALGLTVERRQVVTTDAAPGTVTSVDPGDTVLHPGDLVVLGYAVSPGVGRTDNHVGVDTRHATGLSEAASRGAGDTSTGHSAPASAAPVSSTTVSPTRSPTGSDTGSTTPTDSTSASATSSASTATGTTSSGTAAGDSVSGPGGNEAGTAAGDSAGNAMREPPSSG